MTSQPLDDTYDPTRSDPPAHPRGQVLRRFLDSTPTCRRMAAGHDIATREPKPGRTETDLSHSTQGTKHEHLRQFSRPRLPRQARHRRSSHRSALARQRRRAQTVSRPTCWSTTRARPASARSTTDGQAEVGHREPDHRGVHQGKPRAGLYGNHVVGTPGTVTAEPWAARRRPRATATSWPTRRCRPWSWWIRRARPRP